MPKTATKPDAPPLIDPGLTPEVYEGQWIAKKKFPACFYGYSDVEKETPLTCELYRVDKTRGPLYVLKRNGKVVETVTVKDLEELCRR
jgi:hypothetical protein